MSYRDLNIACVETARMYRVSIGDVLRDFGVRPRFIKDSRDLPKGSSRPDVLIFSESLSEGMNGFLVGSKTGRRVQDFVNAGGICWVMRQARHGFDMTWLPEHLRDTEPKFVHRRALGDEYPQQDKTYVCPWIMDRAHPVWNHPHNIDESHFVSWRVKTLRGIVRSAGTDALWQSGWDVLARNTDNLTLFEDNVALVAEVAHGKGLYFWTEVFPPQAVWDTPGIARDTWGLWMENMLTYFAGRKERRGLRVEVNVSKWSVAAGQSVVVTVSADFRKTHRVQVRMIEAGVQSVDMSVPVADCECGVAFQPRNSGLCVFESIVRDRKGVCGVGRCCCQVVSRATPIRFTIHTHYHNDWSPWSLGYLRGLWKRLGIHVCFLANARSNHSCLRPTTAEELKAADGADMRMFPGMEIHPHVQYGPEDGSPPRGPDDKRRHVTALGHCNLVHSNWLWAPESMGAIHKHGLAIVSHPKRLKWWRNPQAGHSFDGVEIDGISPSNLDWALSQEPPVHGMLGIDLFWNPNSVGNDVNTLWMDNPLTYRNFLTALLQGRISFVGSKAAPIREISEYVWLDICGRPMGGTVYATATVDLTVRYCVPGRGGMLRIVKNGNRNYRRVRLEKGEGQLTLREKIRADCRFHIEVDTEDAGPNSTVRYSGHGYASPVYVKKIPGPPCASFTVETSSSACGMDIKPGRWTAPRPVVKDVEWTDEEWRVVIDSAAKKQLSISGIDIESARINGRRARVIRHKNAKQEIKLPPGSCTLSMHPTATVHR